MENIKGAPVEYKRLEPLTFAPSPASAVAQSLNALTSGGQVVLCQQVPTLRPELLFDRELCGWEPLVYRDTGELAEVAFGRHAELRLASTCSTAKATELVKHFATRELRTAALVAVNPSEASDIALLTRHWQPRVHAAFAFAPTAGDPTTESAPTEGKRQLADLWDTFGGAYALLPTLSYVQVRGSSYLCYLLSPSEAETGSKPATVDVLVRQALERVEQAVRTLTSLATNTALNNTALNNGASTQPRVLPDAVVETPRTAWQKQVNAALDAIGQGALQKVVPARVAQHELEKPASIVGALYALGNTHTDSTKFAFRGPVATFVGATPEHLISKFGPNLTTEALAGTTASNGTPKAFTPKEYHEHSPVLDAILESLAPFCSELTHEVTPVPLRLPHVLHLRTAIAGSLSDANTHVLDLVRALHPTPAVAGAPRAAALSWLAQHEDFERGWYAGPVGWFDAHGNGQFDVALRCGVLTHDRAILFAGAGIVLGSIPEQEFEETVLKLRAMRTALSATPWTAPHGIHLEASKA